MAPVIKTFVKRVFTSKETLLKLEEGKISNNFRGINRILMVCILAENKGENIGGIIFLNDKAVQLLETTDQKWMPG